MPYYPPAAASGAPIDATYITQTANGTLTAEQNLAALATGLLKSTTTTGALSIGVAGTDYAGISFANVFTAGQTFQTTTPITLSTDDSKITGSKSVKIEQTGDSFGTTHLTIQNRSGANGATFTNLGLNLIDFGFKPSTAPQMNLRFEGRSAFMLDGTGNGAKGELQVLLESQVDNGIFAAGFGQATTTLNGTDKIEARATTAVTAAVQDVLHVFHTTSGTPAANFGPGILFKTKVSGSSTVREMGRIYYQLTTATDATRASRAKATAFYTTTERECIAWEANSTAALLGFLGATPIARQAHIVDADGNLADITTKFNTLLSYLENFGFIATS